MNYRYTWHLPKNRTWTYDGVLQMIRDEGRWQVRWTAAGLHPKLGEHQTFALRADPPRRASVNELGGTDVLVPGNLYHYQLDAAKAGGDLMSTARAVVDQLRQFDNTLDPQRLAEQASSSSKPLDLITLRPSDHDKVGPAMDATARRRGHPAGRSAAHRRPFAPAIIGEVKKAVIDQLDGEAGWRVVSVNQNSVDVDVLNEVPPQPAPSVSITLDRAVQNAAQHAVDTQGRKAMIVVIKPSTGEILGRRAERGGRRRRPGRHHRPLPAGVDVQDHHRRGGHRARHGHPQHAARLPGPDRHRPPHDPELRQVRPRHGADVQGVRQLVQHHLRRAGQPDAADRADRGRLPVRHRPGLHIDGLTTVTGQVPPTVNLAERTEDGFGQGKVLVTPFGMALAAATVAAGKTPTPHLIVGTQTTETGDHPQISPAMLDGLRADDAPGGHQRHRQGHPGAGDVRGKTGEAEFQGGSHAWFAGYRGDLAFAALIVGGGSSEYAVRMVKMMFDELPADYLA